MDHQWSRAHAWNNFPLRVKVNYKISLNCDFIFMLFLIFQLYISCCLSEVKHVTVKCINWNVNMCDSVLQPCGGAVALQHIIYINAICVWIYFCLLHGMSCFPWTDNLPRVFPWLAPCACWDRLTLKATIVNLPQHNSFEYLAVKLSGFELLIVVTIYYPFKPSALFWIIYLVVHCLHHFTKYVLLGDFNIHIDSSCCSFTTDLQSLLECLGINQHVIFPTHNKGQILDLDCSTGLTPLSVTELLLPISDHKAVLFVVPGQAEKEKDECTITLPATLVKASSPD